MPRHRHVRARGRKILAKGQKTAAVRQQIGQGEANFAPCFAKAQHDAGFYAQALTGRVAQHFQRSLIAGPRAHLSKKPPHGFKIMIEHIGAGCAHRLKSVAVALKIRHQHFNAGLRACLAYGLDGAHKMIRAAVRQVVPRNRRYDRMVQAQPVHGLRNVVRFV